MFYKYTFTLFFCCSIVIGNIRPESVIFLQQLPFRRHKLAFVRRLLTCCYRAVYMNIIKDLFKNRKLAVVGRWLLFRDGHWKRDQIIVRVMANFEYGTKFLLSQHSSD